MELYRKCAAFVRYCCKEKVKNVQMNEGMNNFEQLEGLMMSTKDPGSVMIVINNIDLGRGKNMKGTRNPLLITASTLQNSLKRAAFV